MLHLCILLTVSPSHMLWIVKYCLSTFALWCLHPQQGLWICECSWLTLRQNKSFLIVWVCLKQWKRKIKTGRKWDRKMGGRTMRGFFTSCEVETELADNNIRSISSLATTTSSINRHLSLWGALSDFFFLFCLYKNRQDKILRVWQHPKNDLLTPQANAKLCYFLPWMLFSLCVSMIYLRGAGICSLFGMR